jgi:Flp pilus assembly protein TadB
VSGLANLLLAQGQLVDPEQYGGVKVSPRAFIGVLAGGFLIGVLGHLFQSRLLIAFGIALIFGATVLAPVLLAILH